jgi:hypothetical protein
MSRRLFNLFRTRRNRWLWITIAVLALVATVVATLTQVDPGRITGTVGEGPTQTPDTSAPAQELVQGPLMFVENVGQFDDAVRFQAPAGNRTVWLIENGFWMTARQVAAGSSTEGSVNLLLSFPDANPHPALEPFNPLDMSVAYYIGNDPANWHTDVPVWGGVRYKDIYPGIDLEVTGAGNRWQPRIVARPGASPETVRIHIDGAERVSIENDRLRLMTAAGDFTLPLLAAEETGAPSISADHDVLNPYTLATAPDQAPDVPRDNPADLLYATFLVGEHRDWGYGVAVDAAGSAYITGETSSTDFPTASGAVGATDSRLNDVFVVKLNPAGSDLEYIAFLSGNHDDWGHDIAIDGSGNAYVTGGSRSGDFPTTPGAYDTLCGADGNCDPDSFDAPGDDAFVAKLGPGGSNLEYATFLGGTSSESGAGIAVDNAGRAYIVGSTQSSQFPTTPGALDTTYNGLYDAFVARLSASGSALEYATFLGGSGNDAGEDVAIAQDHAFITGFTFSPDFPTTPEAFKSSHDGVYGAFVAKLDGGGTSLEYATFLSDDGLEYGRAIAVDEAGSAYVTGEVNSGGFPATSDAFDTSYNDNGDAFVAKLGPGGSTLEYATFLGDGEQDGGQAIAVDEMGNAYVAGDTESPGFPTTPGAFDITYGGGSSTSRGDAFMAKLASDGSTLIYGTFLGGSGGDHGQAIAVDKAGHAYVTGHTNSADFPTTSGAFNPVRNDCATCDDAFVTKLNPPASPTPLYSISGRVVDGRGVPLPGIVVSNGAGRTATTDGSGSYTLDELTAGSHAITLFSEDDAYPSTTRTVVVPPSAAGQDFILLPAPASIILTPDAPATLVYTGTRDLSIQLTFPTGTVAQTTTLTLTPTSVAAGAGWTPLGHAFELGASQEGIPQPDFAFDSPVTVQIGYSDASLQMVSDEGQLTLRWWTGSQWDNVTEKCIPPASYDRNPGENMVTVTLCSTDRLALFGPTRQVHLPIVLQNQ